VPQIRTATPDDVDAIFDLLAARSRAAFGSSEVQRAFVARDFAVAGTDSWVAVEKDSVVGHATLNSGHELAHAARDAAVGDALLERVEARAREREMETLSVTVVPEDQPLSQLVERGGFTHDRDILRMWRALGADLPEPQWPAGVTVRSYEAADGKRVHDLLDATYAAWDAGYVPRPHADWLAAMSGDPEFDAAFWFLVERDGDLVACALHWGPHQRRGWVKDIVVSEAERGRGIAKAMLHHGFRAYRARDVVQVGLKVDSTNPTGAPQLYERVGFVTDRRYGIWTKQL
jgi:mycothiol synthase